jgi:hypothetical protein
VRINGERRQVAVPVAVFTGLVALLALTHTMWRDEVRAFSVATKTASWGQMIGALHEEGHPLLWYALLRVGHAITGSQHVMPVLAAAIGIGAAWVTLRHAPFARPVRLLAVFGAFLVYELTVVARNYGIGVLLIVSACAIHERYPNRPLLLATVLVLLANTSVHGAVAAAILGLVVFADTLRRRENSSPAGAFAGIVFLAAGIVFALATASPAPEMAYSFSLESLEPSRLLRVLFVDPGHGLRGTNGAALVAAGEMPWARIGIDESLASQVLVNVAVLFVGWGLRRNVLHLAAFVGTILGFEVLFRIVYPGALRHQGLLAFLIFGICWLAVISSRDDRAGAVRRISLGLLPLFALQALALPFLVVRHVMHPESMAASLADAIDAEPRLERAVLMSEPDPLMETMPYYADNPVYFPRQREFDYRAYFDREIRQQTMTLTQLMSIADSVGCATRRPVLLSVGYRSFHFADRGSMEGPYGVSFTWSLSEKAAFASRTRPLQWFPGSTGDENYRTYEVIADC